MQEEWGWLWPALVQTFYSHVFELIILGLMMLTIIIALYFVVFMSYIYYFDMLEALYLGNWLSLAWSIQMDPLISLIEQRIFSNYLKENTLLPKNLKMFMFNQTGLDKFGSMEILLEIIALCFLLLSMIFYVSTMTPSTCWTVNTNAIGIDFFIKYSFKFNNWDIDLTLCTKHFYYIQYLIKSARPSYWCKT